MKVYRDGIEIYDLPITASAKHKVTLMKEDYVSIPFVIDAFPTDCVL